MLFWINMFQRVLLRTFWLKLCEKSGKINKDVVKNISLIKKRRILKMKKEYVNPEIFINNFDEDPIFTASVVVGVTPQPGDEEVDGSDIFG